MTYQYPNNRPQRVPGLHPLPPGATPPIFRDVDQTSCWNAGFMAAAFVAALSVVGLFVGAGSGEQTVDDPPETTGQGGQVPPRIAR
jgi:hypothetical protein